MIPQLLTQALASTDSLYQVGQQLLAKGVFNNYLNNQQYLVIDSILNSEYPAEYKRRVWRYFLEGQCKLEIIKDEEPQVKTEETPKEGSPDYSEMELEDLENQMHTLNGTEFVSGLSLKVRYLLWESCIGDDGEYELLDFDVCDASAEPVAEVAVRDDEDDDYDDEEPAETGHVSEAPSLQFDDSGFLVLPIKVTRARLRLNTVDTSVLVDNINRIYHTFENDRETVLKRMKLEANDKKLMDKQASKEEEKQDTISKISVNLGAANLSLKHLLASIEENKDKLDINDYELRHLIMDVRKNRSKWASDDKIGQEELYDACEKVVMELRGWTEHSTPFLNKVSKRDAPNYYNIIKKPMDLNTVLKKLKSFQYTSKAEFVDDVMLIWKNCLSYNTDPSHFLRAHAIAMQKKSLALIPLIPDIVVRDRADVEEEEEPQQETTGKRPHTKKSAPKRVAETESVGNEAAKTGVPGKSVPGKSAPSKSAPPKDPEQSVDAMDIDGPEPQTLDTEAAEGVNSEGVNADGVNAEEEEEEEEEDDYSQVQYGQDDDKDDVELATWKNMTAKIRAEYCIKRSHLFNDKRLNMDTNAILRNPVCRERTEQQIVVKNGFGAAAVKEQEEDIGMIEYNINGCIPEVNEIDYDMEEELLVNRAMQQGSVSKSALLSTETGLNAKINQNISLIQDIRKICHKISLIRQMQQGSSSLVSKYDVDAIDDTVDVDPVSQLDTHDYLHDRSIMFGALKKRVSKLAMSAGFQSCEGSAISAMTDLADDYISNFIKTLKVHVETTTVNKKSTEEIVKTTLLENGVVSSDELFTYVEQEFIKKPKKLLDMKTKLSEFLKVLLRPSLNEFSEKNLDDADTFITGDFVPDGEDFFGFKELGLDKEFDIVSSIPLQFISSKFTSTNEEVAHKEKKIQPEEFNGIVYARLDKQAFDEKKPVALAAPLLARSLERTLHHLKQQQASDDMVLLEDEELPSKLKALKTRLPPTGKVPGNYRKKPISYAYVL